MGAAGCRHRCRQPLTFERFLDDIVRDTFGDAEVVSDDPAIVAGFPAQRISIEDANRETHQENLLIDVPGAIVHITAFSSTGNWPAQEVAFDAFLETIAIG